MTMPLPSCAPLRLAALALALALATGSGHAQSGCAEARAGEVCADLGGFTATALRVALADQPFNINTATRSVRTTVRLRNTGRQPVILAYKAGSLRAVDDLGLDYTRVSAQGVQGIGIAQRGKADPQFQLEPGQQRDIQLELQRGYPTRPSRQALGSVFALDFVLSELRTLSYERIEVVRDHAVMMAELRGRSPMFGQAASGHGTVDDLKGSTQALKKLGH